MAEEPESTVTTAAAADESLLDKISEKLHGHDSSSSSDSDSEKTVTSSVKDKVFRLFGRERPVHSVLGAGKRKTLFFSFSLLLWSSFHCVLRKRYNVGILWMKLSGKKKKVTWPYLASCRLSLIGVT